MTQHKDRSEYFAKWYATNKWRYVGYEKKRRDKDPIGHRERATVRMRNWRKKNSESCRKKALALYHKRMTDPTFQLTRCLRERLRKALTRGSKRSSAIKLLGCSIENLWIYLESRFEPGMTRENYGSVWEVDHIMPCVIFDLTNPEHQKRCFHFSNLQPLFATVNKKKGRKVSV